MTYCREKMWARTVGVVLARRQTGVPVPIELEWIMEAGPGPASEWTTRQKAKQEIAAIALLRERGYSVAGPTEAARK